jgi:hypothetical protein
MPANTGCVGPPGGVAGSDTTTIRRNTGEGRWATVLRWNTAEGGWGTVLRRIDTSCSHQRRGLRQRHADAKSRRHGTHAIGMAPSGQPSAMAPSRCTGSLSVGGCGGKAGGGRTGNPGTPGQGRPRHGLPATARPKAVPGRPCRGRQDAEGAQRGPLSSSGGRREPRSRGGNGGIGTARRRPARGEGVAISTAREQWHLAYVPEDAAAEDRSISRPLRGLRSGGAERPPGLAPRGYSQSPCGLLKDVPSRDAGRTERGPALALRARNGSLAGASGSDSRWVAALRDGVAHAHGKSRAHVRGTWGTRTRAIRLPYVSRRFRRCGSLPASAEGRPAGDGRVESGWCPCWRHGTLL